MRIEMGELGNSSSNKPCWTNVLQICKLAGVGFSPNQKYRRDGYRSNEHELEDQSFHFKLDENMYVYGIFDGHAGSTASKFVAERLLDYVILGQLSEHSTEEEIREVLHEAFLSVEREFFSECIGFGLAERTAFLSELEIPPGSTPYEAYKDYSSVLSKLEALDREVASGTTAVVVLIFKGKLYIANTGDSRALLCRTDDDGVLRVVQLTVDHDLNNEDEILRLHRLSLDSKRLRELGRLGNQENTRCLGNYLVKGGYKEIEVLAPASSDPVIADPDVRPPVPVEESVRFLVLLSDGLYKALEEATENDQVNIQLAQMIVEEFRTQSTLNGLAQAVVDKISRMHHDYFMSSTNPSRINNREDMTLMIRNFNFSLRSNSISSPGTGRFSRFPSYSSSTTTPPTPTNPSQSGYQTPTNPQIVISHDNLPGYGTVTNNSTSNTTDTASTDSSERVYQGFDENKKAEPYVDFSEYYDKITADPELSEYYDRMTADPELKGD